MDPLFWTTTDELELPRKLYGRGDLAGLKLYLYRCRNRIWHGEGMRVCPGEVIFETEGYIRLLQLAKDQKTK